MIRFLPVIARAKPEAIQKVFGTGLLRRKRLAMTNRYFENR